MALIISASIDLTKLDKSKIQTTDKNGNEFKNGAKYYNLDIIVNDDFDKFNNNVQLTDKQTKEQREAKEKKNYLGNGRVVWSNVGKTTPMAETGTTTRDGITTQDDEDLNF